MTKDVTNLNLPAVFVIRTIKSAIRDFHLKRSSRNGSNDCVTSPWCGTNVPKTKKAFSTMRYITGNFILDSRVTVPRLAQEMLQMNRTVYTD